MARQRLINCEFLNASSFKINVSNKAKLLYLMMIVNSDDKGFVDTTNDIINALTDNDKEFDNKVSLELIETTYTSALQELLQRGYLYEFKDNHNNKVHLIRHWFFHNKLKKGLWTNYRNFLDMVQLESNEYILAKGKKPLKEDKIKEDNINQDIVNQYMEQEETEKPKPKSIEDFSQEELEKMSEDEVRALLPI